MICIDIAMGMAIVPGNGRNIWNVDRHESKYGRLECWNSGGSLD